MIKEYLRRADIKKLIDNISINDRYYQKTNEVSYVFLGIDDKNKALYILYDALLKYKLIIDDVFSLDSFVEQLDLLFRKLSDFNDIILGINKLITRLCIKKLNIGNTDTFLNRKLLLDYIYNAYIINGYYIHGFSSVYKEYNIINVSEKDFNKKEIYFTDSLLYGCSSSMRGPMYLFNIISNSSIDKKIDSNALVRDDYKACIKNLKRIFFVYDFSDSDKKYVLDVVEKEWELLHRVDKKIDLLLVKRRLFNVSDNININQLAEDVDLDINEAVDDIMYPKILKYWN